VCSLYEHDGRITVQITPESTGNDSSVSGRIVDRRLSTICHAQSKEPPVGREAETMNHLPAFLGEFLRCWHEQDAEGCASFYTPDGVMIDQMLDAPIRGTDAIKLLRERDTGSTEGVPWEVVGASYLRRVDGLIARDHAVWDLSLVASDA
jgi:hypothetical protein